MYASVIGVVSASVNGLAPDRHQTITWTKDDLCYLDTYW